MPTIYYITHPNVAIDPTVPVPAWGLNEVGVERTVRMLGQPWVASISRVVCSAETKAIETANILAKHLGLTAQIRSTSGENDRSATGFVPPERFETLANTFFARPTESVEGWERAVDAQTRITHALADLFEPTAEPRVDLGFRLRGTIKTDAHTAGQDTNASEIDPDRDVETVEASDSPDRPLQQDGATAIIGHGGVGTLWYCQLAGLRIDRRHDQPGQGHYFAVDQATRKPLHGWRPIDDIEPRL